MKGKKMNRNQDSIEQLKRLTQSAKNFYGNNYSPGFISHRNDTKHYLGEEYIPYDWGDDIDSPANDEYKNVYLNKNPNYDFTPKTQNLMQTPKPLQPTTQFQAPKPQTMKTPTLSTSLMPKQKLKGFGDYMADYIYQTYMGQDRLRTVSSPVGKYKTISSYYKIDR